MEQNTSTHTQRLLQGAVVVHLLFVASKLGIGFMTGAMSMVATGIHSGISMISAAATASEEHQKGTLAEAVRQYGDAQADHILAVMEAFLILLVSTIILYESSQRLMVSPIISSTLPWAMGLMALATIAQTIFAQAFHKASKKAQSSALAASAIQSRLDVWSAGLLFTGLAVMDITGWFWLDNVLAAAVAIRMMYTAGLMLKTHCLGFSYIPLSTIEENRIGRIIMATPGVLGYHNLHLKNERSTMKVCFHLEVSRDLPSYQACAVSDAVSMSLILHYGPCTPAIHIDRT